MKTKRERGRRGRVWAGRGDYLVAGARLLVILLVGVLMSRRAVVLVVFLVWVSLWSFER